MRPRHVLYVGLLAAVLIVPGCGPAATPEPTPMPPTDTAAPTATEAAKPMAIEGEVPMGFTEDGSPYRGNPDAPVTLVEHSEFQ